nr:MAG TPA: hypothetical protein [Caudoviricetes sp.]
MPLLLVLLFLLQVRNNSFYYINYISLDTTY